LRGKFEGQNVKSTETSGTFLGLQWAGPKYFWNTIMALNQIKLLYNPEAEERSQLPFRR